MWKTTSDAALTERAHEILKCLADGMNNKNIARNRMAILP